MFKKLLAVAMLVAVAAPAKADMMDGQKGVGAQLGYATIGGDLGDVAKAGTVFGVHYYQALQNNFAVVPCLDYFSFGAKSSGADITNTAISINGVYNITQMGDMPVMPFAFIGLSYNMMSADSSGGTDNDSGIGYNLGIGANKNINDKLIGGLTLSYRIFPDFESSGSKFTGNSMVIGLHIGYKLGA